MAHPLDDPVLYSWRGVEHTSCFIGGRWRKASSGLTRQITDPANGRTIATVDESGPDDVDAAVQAATAAFGLWSSMDGLTRSRILSNLANALEADAEHFATLEALDSGKPRRIARFADVASSIRVLRHHASLADTCGIGSGRIIAPPTTAAAAGSLVYTVTEPVGVVGAITPFNFPLCGAVAKIAPALATGCTVVLKPSHQSPLSTLAFAALCHSIGVPDGVVNVIPGGREAGAALAAHPGVQKLSFTGSVAAGRSVGVLAAQRGVPVTLELGGKNPLIICPDWANVDEAAKIACGANFFNAGQLCVAASRVLVPHELHDAFITAVVSRVRARVLGDQWREETEMGPLVDSAAAERVVSMINAGVAAGARVECGGRRWGPPGGAWVEPTVLSGVEDTNPVACDEIFGPVMVVQRYGSLVPEAIARANATPYGLSAVVLTRNTSTALMCSSKLRAGTIWVGTHGVFDPSIPYGGLKASGLGKEYGFEGISAYTVTKTVVLAASQ